MSSNGLLFAVALLLATWSGSFQGGSPVQTPHADPSSALRQAASAAVDVLEGSLQPTALAFADQDGFRRYEDVSRYTQGIKLELLNGLTSDGDFEALRSYIELEFPQIPDSAIRSFAWAGSDKVLTDESFLALIEAVRAFLGKINKISPVVVDFRIETVPSGASVVIRPVLGWRTRETTSDGQFQNLYRGVYSATISRPGYESIINLEIDLVDDPRTVLQCALVAESTANENGSRCDRKG